MTIVFVFVTYHDIVALLLLPAAFHCFESWACDAAAAAADDDDDNDYVYMMELRRMKKLKQSR